MNIKNILIVLVIISTIILGIMFFQDSTKKLEDRSYREINKLIIHSESANINIHKSDSNIIRVVAFGSNKDTIEIIEGTRYLTINQSSNGSICFINCRKELDIYIPDDFEEVNIETNSGNINADKVTIKNVVINTKVGNISLNKTNYIDIASNVGSIYVKEINATANSSIVSKAGNIRIDKIINLNLDISTKKGNKVVPVIKNMQDYTLKIETDNGNVDIDSHEDKS